MLLLRLQVLTVFIEAEHQSCVLPLGLLFFLLRHEELTYRRIWAAFLFLVDLLLLLRWLAVLTMQQ